MRILTMVCLTLFASSLSLSAAETTPTFAAKPSAVRNGEKVKISFTVVVPTDVEVAILDGSNVVCHLAAGVLGAKNPPPEPLKAGLAQSIEWDGKDDFGKAAVGGPFQVRVRAGTDVKLGRFISDSPYMISDIRGLATDADGNIYVLSQNFGYGTIYIQIFDSEGRYLRTIMPFPANLPKESVASFARWDDKGNRPIPQNWMDCYGSFFPVKGMPPTLQMTPSVTKESGLLIYQPFDIFRVAIDGGDGGRPVYLSATYSTGRRNRKGQGSADQYPDQKFFAATSPDGKVLYATGLCAKDPKNADWPAGGIYSMKLDGKDHLEPFATADMPDTWPKTKGAPVEGLATDSAGLIYVGDRVNGQIVVFDPNGKKVGSIPVKFPSRVAVHPKTAEVYVLTCENVGYCRHKKSLVKFSGYKDPKQVALLDFGAHDVGFGGHLALSVNKDKTAIWIGGVEQVGFRVGRADLTRYEDRGSEFVATVKVHEKDAVALGNHDCIAVDPSNEDVYINDDYSGMYRYNGLTGEGGALSKIDKNFKATDLAVGPDGYLYVRTDHGLGYSGPFERLDRNLKPVPFASGTNVLSKYIYSRFGAGYGEKGIGVGRDGKAYINFMYGWTTYAVYGFDAKGQPLKGAYLEGKMSADNYKNGLPVGVKGAIIGPVPKSGGGLRVDSKGNIYIGVNLLPKDYVKPELYAKDIAWDATVGSVVKFGPEGGAWVKTGKDPYKDTDRPLAAGEKAIAMNNDSLMLGAKAVYLEIAPFSGSYASGAKPTAIGKMGCDCRSPRFDLDRYDRVYMPNAIGNSVKVCDNAGNVVIQFGSYGNYDSQLVLPESKDNGSTPSAGSPRGRPLVATPDIPLAWPIGVGVSDEHIYVCDQMNRRIVRVDKTYGAEQFCRVPTR